MTLGTWLRARTPVAPPRLVVRIEEVLGARSALPSSEAQQHCVMAAAELLRDLLSRPSAGRESALDLLTVDALVTYAFEAAATDPEALSTHASGAMTMLANAAW